VQSSALTTGADSGSLLGSELSIDEGSEDGFVAWARGGIEERFEDGSSLGFQLGIDERFGIGIEDGIRHGSVGLELYIDDSSEGDIRGALTMTGRLQRWHQGRPQRWLVAWRIGEDSISALTKVFNIR